MIRKISGSRVLRESRTTMDSVVQFDTIIQYKVSGEKVEHHIAPSYTNKERLELFAKLLGGELCGLEQPELFITIFVKCNSDVLTDGMNDAATQLCGMPVAGDALIVAKQLMDEWNS